MASHFLKDVESSFVRGDSDEKDATLREKTPESESAGIFDNDETTEKKKDISKEESVILRKFDIKRKTETTFYDDSAECISTEKLSDYKESMTRKQIHIDLRRARNCREKNGEEKKLQEKHKKNAPRTQQEKPPTLLCVDSGIADTGAVKRKIPRPVNAFMLFANEWRKKLATENPRESNKDISVRLLVKTDEDDNISGFAQIGDLMEKHGKGREGEVLCTGAEGGRRTQEEVSRACNYDKWHLLKIVRPNPRTEGRYSVKGGLPEGSEAAYRLRGRYGASSRVKEGKESGKRWKKRKSTGSSIDLALVQLPWCDSSTDTEGRLSIGDYAAAPGQNGGNALSTAATDARMTTCTEKRSATTTTTTRRTQLRGLPGGMQEADRTTSVAPSRYAVLPLKVHVYFHESAPSRGTVRNYKSTRSLVYSNAKGRSK
ncbi:hypothetical protein KM043_016288 [Ampulex compressa]|nr:hypothetical protein KM043_016288 [Ampulex compressa]